MSASSDPLGMPDEELRALGHWLVDALVDDMGARADGPALTAGDPVALRDALGGPPPRRPGDPAAALRTLLQVAAGHMQHGDHPRYFARVPGPSSSAGVLGDWLATGVNAIASSWGGGAGPTTVELVVIGWLAELLGFPAGTEGLATSGGSLGNLTAFAAARAAAGDGPGTPGAPGVVYLSDQAHSSLRRGLATLGVPDRDVRVIATDDARPVLTAEAVTAAVAEDQRARRRPWLVVASAGTTNTGSVDELDGLADVCAAESLWLHVDGAYGAPAALCAAGRRTLTGMHRADSLALDPHKWMFAPYDAGVLLVRRPGALEAAFGMRPEYLADVRASGTDEVDLGTRGPELTRRARAFKLWTVFRTYGVDAIATAIARGIELAEHAEGLLDADPFWECVTRASLGIVTFTHPGWSAREHAARAGSLSDTGFAAITSTTLRGRAALRLCTINPRTTEADLAGTLARLKSPPPGR